MRCRLVFSCALLLTGGSGQIYAQNSPASGAGESSARSAKPSLEEQMREVLDEIRAVREENQLLKERMSRLELNAPPNPAPNAAPSAAPTAQPAAAAAQPNANVVANAARSDAPAPSPEDPLKLFTPYGELGFRYQGLFNSSVSSPVAGTNHLTNLYNRGEGLIRFGLKGQITDRLSYNLRVSSGVSSLAGDPWISLASPGQRRFVGFDTYTLTWSMPTDWASPNATNLVIVGKVNNIPGATGLTEMLVDKDFGLEMAADLAIYKFNANTSGSLLTAAGFVTNQGAVGPFAPGNRFLEPVVSGGNTGCPGGLLCGDISDINQYGSPRANAYVVETAMDHTFTAATKIRGSFLFANISHPSDVPLFIGATGLLGLDGLRMPNYPQGIQTNIPLCLPRDSNGVVPISNNSTNGGDGATALMTGELDCGYASAYRLIDFFGSVTMHADRKYPIRLLGEWVQNIGAGDYARQAAANGRTPAGLLGSTTFTGVTFQPFAQLAQLAKKRRDGLVLGADFGSPAAKGYSFTYKFLLIGSDIMLDYPTNDQWHTNIRGHELAWQYRFNKNLAWETSFVISKNYDPLLPGFSALSLYPLADLGPGQNPWMTRIRSGAHVTF